MRERAAPKKGAALARGGRPRRARQDHLGATILAAVPPVARSTAHAAALAALLCAAFACVPRDRMCAIDDPCAAGLACVTGRCVPGKAAVRLLEVDDAGSPLVKRRAFAPTDLAWLTPQTREGAGVPLNVGLGSPAGGVLLLRFADVVVPADLVEAYVVLRRVPDVDPPTGIVVLHAERVQDDWESRTLSPSRAPRLFDLHAPETRVLGAADEVVRVDVRALVSGWATRSAAHQGIAIVATSDRGAPLYVALAPVHGLPAGPVLELYSR